MVREIHRDGVSTNLNPQDGFILEAIPLITDVNEAYVHAALGPEVPPNEQEAGDQLVLGGEWHTVWDANPSTRVT